LNGLARSISKIPMASMARAIWPNIVIGVIVIFVVTCVPWTVTVLVDLIPQEGSKE
jgi:TRAP-type C4-dicarboxylate transport system permease large subunit